MLSEGLAWKYGRVKVRMRSESETVIQTRVRDANQEDAATRPTQPKPELGEGGRGWRGRDTHRGSGAVGGATRRRAETDRGDESAAGVRGAGVAAAHAVPQQGGQPTPQRGAGGPAHSSASGGASQRACLPLTQTKLGRQAKVSTVNVHGGLLGFGGHRAQGGEKTPAGSPAHPPTAGLRWRMGEGDWRWPGRGSQAPGGRLRMLGSGSIVCWLPVRRAQGGQARLGQVTGGDTSALLGAHALLGAQSVRSFSF